MNNLPSIRIVAMKQAESPCGPEMEPEGAPMFASFGGEDYASARKEMIRHEAEERGEDIPGGTGKLEPIRLAAQRIHEIGDMLDEFMAGKGSSDNSQFGSSSGDSEKIGRAKELS